MANKVYIIANITLMKDKPTEVTFDDLYEWVIWQYPRQKDGGLCGAVHPPLANHTWYPALIAYLDKKVLIYGHIDKLFRSPDEAAEWLESSMNSF